MSRPSNISIILLSILSLSFLAWYFFSTTITSPTSAAQDNKIGAQQSELETNNPQYKTAIVTNVITTDSFTYVEVETDKEKVWVAGPGASLNKGDKISFSTTMPMSNFHSKVLDRDFSIIYFTHSFQADDKTSVAESTNTLIKGQKPITAKETTNSEALSEVPVGGYLREVVLDSLTGQTKSFSAFKGKPLIINIWASWCGPCLSEMGSLERLSHWNEGKDFNIIGISTDDYRDRAEGFVKQTAITFENFIDHQLVLEKMLGANSIPLTLFVDANGKILEKVRGARQWDHPEIIKEIGKVFRNNAGTAVQTSR